MRLKPAYFVLALACLLLGFIIAVQLKVVDDMNTRWLVNLDRPRALAEQIKVAQLKNESLQQEVERLRTRLDKAVEGQPLANLKNKLDKAKTLAGFTEVEGPGVKVILNDSQENIKPGDDPNLYILHDEDVIKVLNELKAAGAEAISMNGQRIIATTEVRCIGPTVLINKSVRLSPPFVVKAIGNPDTLYNALNMKGGLVYFLQWWGIEVKVEKAEKLIIPPYGGGISLDFAQPVK